MSDLAKESREKMHEKANTFPGFSHVCTAECGSEADAPVVAS